MAESGIDAGQISAIGITYQMHGLVCVDKDKKVLRPSIIWCDSRAVDYGNKAAEQIGPDYVLSYRPSPADMVSYNLPSDRIRSILKADLEACKHCHVDITLKDVQTVQRDPTRVHRWVDITRGVIDEVFG